MSRNRAICPRTAALADGRSPKVVQTLISFRMIHIGDCCPSSGIDWFRESMGRAGA